MALTSTKASYKGEITARLDYRDKVNIPACVVYQSLFDLFFLALFCVLFVVSTELFQGPPLMVVYVLCDSSLD